MAGLTRADYVDMLEELYPEDDLLDMVMKERPALALLTRRKLRGGQRYVHQPVRYVKPQGRSADFSEAQTNRTPSQVDAFQVTYVSNYGYATVDGDVIDDAGENVELVADAVQFEMDGAIDNVSDDLAQDVYSNHGGARGVVGSISTTELTLATIEDVVNFEQNMELQGSENDGTTGSLQDSGASATVTSINYDTGVLTSDSNWTAQMASLDAGDYLFVKGDFGVKVAGFEAWDPATAPTSTAFYGVDRSTNTRLGGQRYDGSGKAIDEALMNAAARAHRYGAKLDRGFLNPLDWNNLGKSLEAKGVLNRDTVRGSGDAARFGFDAIMMPTAAGVVAIVSDPFAPKGVARLLQDNTWRLYHSGNDLVRIIDHDDSKMMRETNNDGVEFRIKFRGNLVCAAPGQNMRCAL